MGGDHLVEALCGDEVEEEKGEDIRHRVDGWTTSGAVAVYHSIVELRNSLDEWLTS